MKFIIAYFIINSFINKKGVFYEKSFVDCFILGSLYGTAHAAPITSPIYMPESGGILMKANVGYAMQSFDTVSSGDDDEIYKSFYINLNGKIGIIDRLALNYTADLSLYNTNSGRDMSAKFNNFSGGLTGRVIDAGVNKFDVIVNVGQEQLLIAPAYSQVFVEAAARYGLEFSKYNLGVSINGKYLNGFEIGEYEKYDNGFAFGLTLENKFIFTEKITMGLNLSYQYNSKMVGNEYNETTGSYEKGEEVGAYNQYGVGIDFDYGFTDNLFLGAYANYNFTDIEAGDSKDTSEYKFGLRLTSKF